jgi:hypothetical protein
MQLADWLFTLLALRSDDPHGRSALDVALASAKEPAQPSAPPPRPAQHV